MIESHRVFCEKIQGECIAEKCSHFRSRRPMTKYERTCVLCFDAFVDPFVYDWCEKFKKRVPILEVEVFPDNT
jgi:hypothetical protein